MSFLKTLRWKIRTAILGNQTVWDYKGDAFAVRKKLTNFMTEPQFAQSWAEVAKFNAPYWSGQTPDIRWRSHVAIWAAKHALNIEGNFAEFGVNTGILSKMVMENVAIEGTGRKFYLFDTYDGIPIEMASDIEKDRVLDQNTNLYNHDSYKVAQEVFKPYESAVLVKGILPESLDQVDYGKLAYVSIDMNICSAEISVIERIWNDITPGGVIVLDDYAWQGHEEQYEGWNAFAARNDRLILTVPTGQGLIIR